MSKTDNPITFIAGFAASFAGVLLLSKMRQRREDAKSPSRMVKKHTPAQLRGRVIMMPGNA